MHLYIANKLYSSWSLRPWMLLKALGIPFRETVIPMYQPDSQTRMKAVSPTGKMPVLVDGDVTVWESLAIIEYLSEKFPDREVWPKGDKPADFNTPLKGDLPVLVLTGEFDPVTPPKYGEEVAKGLPNSRWLNLKGQGHNVIGAGCMPKLFAQFIEKADAKALDAKCLDKLAYVPPFTSYNGWEP